MIDVGDNQKLCGNFKFLGRLMPTKQAHTQSLIDILSYKRDELALGCCDLMK